MEDFFNMAKSGRVWLFGDGHFQINPIHGADLATAIFEAVERGAQWADIVGPDTYSQNEIAQLCFAVLGKPSRITLLPDMARRVVLWALPRLAPRKIAGPVQFFLSAGAMNMTAPKAGQRQLADHFRNLVGATP